MTSQRKRVSAFLAAVFLAAAPLQARAAVTGYYKLNTDSNTLVGAFNGTDTGITYLPGGVFGTGHAYFGDQSLIDLNVMAYGYAGGVPFSFSMMVSLEKDNMKYFFGHLYSNNFPQCGFSGYRTYSDGKKIYFELIGDSIGDQKASVYADYTFPTYTWVFLTFTYTGTDTGASNLKIYVNGTLQNVTVAQDNYGLPLQICVTNPSAQMGSAVIGDDPSFQARSNFRGSINEVKIYNTELTPRQVKELYTYYKGFF